LRTAEDAFIRVAVEKGPELVPGVPASFFSVRWSGQLNPVTNGVHAFRVVADEGIRFWLNDELVIDRWNEIYPGEYKHLAKLSATHPVSIRLETLNTDGQTVAKLFWTQPGSSETVLSGSVLQPTVKSVAPVAAKPRDSLQPGGIFLSKGTFIPIQPEMLDATTLKLAGPVVRLNLPRPRVARIYFRPLSAEQQARLQPTRTGALLENGDFVEGEVLSLKGTEARIDSVLFGRRSFHAPGPVMALIVDALPVPAPNYRLAVKGLGTVLASDVRLTRSGVSVPELGGYTFSGPEILELARTE
jgi:hypothetical protein